MRKLLEDLGLDEDKICKILSEHESIITSIKAQFDDIPNRIVLPPSGVSLHNPDNPFSNDAWDMEKQAELFKKNRDAALLFANQAGRKIF